MTAPVASVALATSTDKPAILGLFILKESERCDQMRSPGSTDIGGHDCCCESVCGCYPVF